MCILTYLFLFILALGSSLSGDLSYRRPPKRIRGRLYDRPPVNDDPGGSHAYYHTGNYSSSTISSHRWLLLPTDFCSSTFVPAKYLISLILLSSWNICSPHPGYIVSGLLGHVIYIRFANNCLLPPLHSILYGYLSSNLNNVENLQKSPRKSSNITASCVSYPSNHFPSTPLIQASPFSSSMAKRVFPVPLGPQNQYTSGKKSLCRSLYFKISSPQRID